MSVSLQLQDVYKHFGTEFRIDVLRGISFSLAAGQNLAVMGPSGSGKSTLLHLIGTLDTPSSGEIVLNGKNPFTLSEPELARFRNRVIGFVFQDHHLLPQYTVLENVLIPALAASKIQKDVEQRAQMLLKRVGLDHRLNHPPAKLSGGESQRAAVARALINQPFLLLCDEPTGNLDSATAESVADLLFDLHQQEQNILIVVTHNADLAKRFENSMRLIDGQLQTTSV
jgi:lipoprotein-releasing system ATP-binding protein